MPNRLLLTILAIVLLAGGSVALMLSIWSYALWETAALIAPFALTAIILLIGGGAIFAFLDEDEL